MSAERTPRGTISLSTPARGEYVHVLRSVTAGVGATLDFSIDDIEDLRLAVDEACAHLLKLDPRAAVLRLIVEPGDDAGLTITVGITSLTPNGEAPATDQFLTWHILAALTDGAEAIRDDEGPAIRFIKRKTS